MTVCFVDDACGVAFAVRLRTPQPATTFQSRIELLVDVDGLMTDISKRFSNFGDMPYEGALVKLRLNKTSNGRVFLAGSLEGFRTEGACEVKTGIKLHILEWYASMFLARVIIAVVKLLPHKMCPVTKCQEYQDRVDGREFLVRIAGVPYAFGTWGGAAAPNCAVLVGAERFKKMLVETTALEAADVVYEDVLHLRTRGNKEFWMGHVESFKINPETWPGDLSGRSLEILIGIYLRKAYGTIAEKLASWPIFPLEGLRLSCGLSD